MGCTTCGQNAQNYTQPVAPVMGPNISGNNVNVKSQPQAPNGSIMSQAGNGSAGGSNPVMGNAQPGNPNTPGDQTYGGFNITRDNWNK